MKLVIRRKWHFEVVYFEVYGIRSNHFNAEGISNRVSGSGGGILEVNSEWKKCFLEIAIARKLFTLEIFLFSFCIDCYILAWKSQNGKQCYRNI